MKLLISIIIFLSLSCTRYPKNIIHGDIHSLWNIYSLEKTQPYIIENAVICCGCFCDSTLIMTHVKLYKNDTNYIIKNIYKIEPYKNGTQ